MALNAKDNRRKSQKRSSRKTNNIRVLRPKRRTRLNIGRVFLLGISLAFIIWAIYPITYRLEQSHELDKLKKQLYEIERQNDDLKKDVKRLGSDEYVEQRARTLGLSKADEEIVVVVPESSREHLKGKADGDEKEKNGPTSLWQKITGIFSHMF